MNDNTLELKPVQFYNDDLMAMLSGWWELTRSLGFCARCDGEGYVFDRGDEMPCPMCGAAVVVEVW